MADILINEISQNYSYVIGDNSYCCVALPITSCWGPAYTGPSEDEDIDATEDIVWQRFRANSQGLESFVSTYRGAAANYRLSEDYSYQMAVSLLTAGYDVLVCRLSPGSKSQGFLRRTSSAVKPQTWGTGLSVSSGSTLNGAKQGQSRTVSPSGEAAQSAIVTRIVECYAFANDTPTDHTPLIEGKDYSFTSGTSTTPAGILFLSTSEVIPAASSQTEVNVHVSFVYYTREYESEVVQGNTTLVSLDTPFYCNTDHPVVVTSSHPSFQSATLTSTVTEVPSNAPTGVYAIASGADALVPSVASIVFHLNGTTAQRQNSYTWESSGIVGGTKYTVQGDTDLVTSDHGELGLKAKYPGTFGNRLQCSLRRMITAGVKYWSLVTYIVDVSGVRTAVENLNFVFDVENSTENIPYVEEVQSQFVDIVADRLNEESIFADSIDDKLTIVFTSGTDKGEFTDVQTSLKAAVDLAATRYNTSIVDVSEPAVDTFDDVHQNDVVTLQHQHVEAITKLEYRENSEGSWTESDPTAFYEVVNLDAGTVKVKGSPFGPAGFQVRITYTYSEISSAVPYVNVLCDKYNNYENVDDTTAQTYEYLEWVFTNCLPLYTLLEDKLAYNPNRVISPGWDDQNFLRLTGESSYPLNITTPSPIHLKLMETAYKARCATAYIDLPKSLAKKYVSNDAQDSLTRGYAQLLARQEYADTDGLFTTHSALFGPWGNYVYVGTSKQSTASPSFLALLIQRSMILNQSLQYEWIQPTSRKNNVKIGKMDYTVSKKYLDLWQPDPDTEGGVGVNAIANIPDLGLSIWGDSTLYENPPATYQALRNLSTRLLVNAIKNVVYRVGVSITFQYTNQTAFSSFYVGVTPILDSMKNAGAIDDYKVVIGNDFDALGMVKANSCVGRIFITPNGTIQRITVDLIALPPQTDLTNYS